MLIGSIFFVSQINVGSVGSDKMGRKTKLNFQKECQLLFGSKIW